MNNNKEIIVKVEKELSFLLEIIRRESIHKNYMSINLDILLLVSIKLKGRYDKISCELWEKLVDSINDAYSFNSIKNIINEYINYYGIKKNNTNLDNNSDTRLLTEVIYYLNNLNIQDIDSEFILTELFFNFYSKYIKMQFKGLHTNIISDEIISDFISEIIELNDNDKILDPFVGTGVLLYKVLNKKRQQNDLFVYFQDINIDMISLSEILMNNSLIEKYKSECINSITDGRSIYSREKFDLVVSDIPYVYNSRIYQNELYEYMLNDIDSLIIMQIIDRLTYDGKAYLIIPDRILYKGKKFKKLREELVERDYIDCIIKFENKSKFAGGQSLIVLSKQKSKFRDGIQFIKVNNNNFFSAVKWYENRIQNEFSQIVSRHDIISRDYGLMFTYYNSIYNEVDKLLSDGVGFKLGEVCSLCKSTALSNESGFSQLFPFVKISNLSSSIKEKYLEFDDTITHSIPMNINNLLNQEAVIISLIGTNLKPTIFSPNVSEIKEVFLSTNCVALIPKSNEIDIDYLYYQLSNPMVYKQIEGLRKGGAIQRLSYTDLLDIVILKPEYDKSLLLDEYRKDSIDELENSKDRIESMKNEYELKLIESENQIINMLIHNTGKYFSQIGHGMQILSKFLREHDLLEIEADPELTFKLNENPLVKMGKKEKIKSDTINDVIVNMTAGISMIEKTYSDTQKTVNLNLSDEDFESVNICEVIHKVIDLRNCLKTTEYKVVIDCNDIIMRIHMQSFKEFINNLIVNAEMHGFVEKKKGYFIKIKVKEQKNRILLEFINNGQKFSLNKDQFVLSGKKRLESKGTGQGGAYINRVVLAHKGDFTIDYDYDGTKFDFVFMKGDTK